MSGAAPASATIRRIAHQLSWSFVGAAAGGISLLTIYVVSGRILGPAEFGTASLAFAIANVLLVVSSAGMDFAAGRQLARDANDSDAATSTASTAIAVLAVSATVVAAALFLSRGWFEAHSSASASVFAAAAVMTPVLAGRAVLDRLVAARARFRTQAAARIVEAVTAVTVTVWVLRRDDPPFWAMIAGMSVGGIALVAVYLGDLLPLLRPRAVSLGTARQLMRFARWNMVSYAVLTLLLFGDKLVVGHFVGQAGLGVYTAYYTLSMGASVQLVAVCTNVLLPNVATRGDLRPVVSNLHRLALVACPAWFIVVWTGLMVVVPIYGASYPRDVLLAACFAAWTTLLCLNQVFAVPVWMASERSYRSDMVFQPVRLGVACCGLLVAHAAGHLSSVSVLTSLVLAEAAELANLVRLHAAIDVRSGATRNDLLLGGAPLGEAATDLSPH